MSLSTYIISLAVFKLLRIIGQICAFDMGTSFLTHSFGVKGSTLMDTKFDLKKLEISLYGVVKMRFEILHRLGVVY